MRYVPDRMPTCAGLRIKDRTGELKPADRKVHVQLVTANGVLEGDGLESAGIRIHVQ